MPTTKKDHINVYKDRHFERALAHNFTRIFTKDKFYISTSNTSQKHFPPVFTIHQLVEEELGKKSL